jgi:hypothetical protein
MPPALVSVVAGLLLSQAAWIDPLFVPLVLAGPPISGAVVASRGGAVRWAALAWAVAGLGMLVSDWLVNHEDVAFHAVLAVVMAVLATIGGLVTAAVRHRARSGSMPA